MCIRDQNAGIDTIENVSCKAYNVCATVSPLTMFDLDFR